ncbi:MAG: S1 RNA-binding domain-containing protein [Chitinispirillaceae bacterium]|nr:S1 RNA-binding domain-containing protein [Chitinispirillaceae bacterium]
MLDKKDDTYFDEKTAEDEASDALRKMIDARNTAIKTDLKPGARVTGTVTKVGPRYVFLDIGAKNEAVIHAAELKDKEGKLAAAVGDRLTAFIVSDAAGETVLSKSLSGKGRTAAVQELRGAMESRVPVQGKVTGINKGGLNVKVLGHRTFCPVSQIDLKFTEDINSYLGKTLDFVIMRITEGGRNVVVSRIPLLEGGLEKTIDALAKAGEARLVLKGKISRVADFGLFVDLGDCEGLVHISEVSWERAENLAHSFTVGQEVECVVLSVEKKSPLRNSKISLSIRQTTDNPWKTVASKFAVGQAVAGTVTRLMPFGAFVELAPGIEGLVHVSEMSWTKRVNHPSEVVTAGQPVQVTILAIDETKRTVSLSLKDAGSDPWRDIETRFPAGSDAAGKAVRKAKFGYFIDLAEGVTGLLPIPNIAPDKRAAITENAVITVHIESIDIAQRRISLSFGKKESQQVSAEARVYLAKQTAKPPQAAARSTEFGSALLEALKKKGQ